MVAYIISPKLSLTNQLLITVNHFEMNAKLIGVPSTHWSNHSCWYIYTIAPGREDAESMMRRALNCG